MDPVPATPTTGVAPWSRWLFVASLPLVVIAIGGITASMIWPGELAVHFSGLAAMTLIPAIATCRRRPWMASILMLALLSGCWPWWRSAREPRAPLASHPQLSLATANIYDFNASRAAALDRLRTLSVDLLAVQEVHLADRPALQERWPYVVMNEDRHLLASALFSRHPIVWSFIHDLDGYALVDALIQTPSGLVRIYVAHLHSPTSPAALAIRTRQLHELALLVRDSAEPVLLMGDLNLGSVSPRWSEFANTAGIQRPAGTSPGTWPAWLGPAGTDIDHLAGRGFDFAPLNVFTIPGSDHRGLMTACSVSRMP